MLQARTGPAQWYPLLFMVQLLFFSFCLAISNQVLDYVDILTISS